MGAYSSLEELSKPVDMTGWPDPYAAGDIPEPIAPIRPLSPLSTSTPTATTSTGSGRAGSLGVDSSGNPNVAAVPSLTGPGTIVSSITAWIKANLEDFVFIIIGIVLIGGAAFSFKGTQTVIKTAGKAAAEVAA